MMEMSMMNSPIKINGEFMPFPEGNTECMMDNCDYASDWDNMAIHITLVHNDNGRKRSFYNGGIAPDEVLNHPDWRGYDE
jgi:hypothetical protein